MLHNLHSKKHVLKLSPFGSTMGSHFGTSGPPWKTMWRTTGAAGWIRRSSLQGFARFGNDFGTLVWKFFMHRSLKFQFHLQLVSRSLFFIDSWPACFCNLYFRVESIANNNFHENCVVYECRVECCCFCWCLGTCFSGFLFLGNLLNPNDF